MEKTQAMEALKGALLLEMKGKAFYEQTARQTNSAGLRRIFETMAVEESGHIEVLSKQMRSLGKSGIFEPVKSGSKAENFSDQVINEQIRREITASGYEAAAISAAMALEDRAVRFYQDRATATADVMEKEIYQWLADWEKSHLNLLTALDRQLMETIWYDNQFWPLG